jgi:hypothetical protein
VLIAFGLFAWHDVKADEETHSLAPLNGQLDLPLVDVYFPIFPNRGLSQATPRLVFKPNHESTTATSETG